MILMEGGADYNRKPPAVGVAAALPIMRK